MPRPERPIDPSAGPIQAFAAELRKAREQAGNPKYLQMARATGRSRTALSEAAGGDHLPTWETVEAFLTACAQDPADWLSRWEAVRTQINPQDAPPAAVTGPPLEPAGALAAEPPLPTTPSPVSEGSRWRRPVLASGSVAILIVLALVGFDSLGHSSAARPKPTASVTVLVQNKIATGSSGLIEDTTPVYLSNRPIPFCSRNGCEVPNTSMWSGAILQALCQIQGTGITNANTTTTGIEHNPNVATSTIWYLVQTPDDTTGYISEVYLTPASRGGLGLPTCAP